VEVVLVGQILDLDRVGARVEVLDCGARRVGQPDREPGADDARQRLALRACTARRAEHASPSLDPDPPHTSAAPPLPAPSSRRRRGPEICFLR